MRWLAAALLLVACKGAPPSAPPPPDAGAVSLVEQLEKEAGQRATGTPTPEQVFDALDAAGIKVERRKQIVASPLGARFCMGGFVNANAGIVACEYADEAAAAKGREVALARFRGARQSEIFIHKKSTLTMAAGDDAGAAVAAKVKAIFEAL